MNNPIKNLLGKTFPIVSRNIGNIIEQNLGGTINPFAGADFGFWEVKSRRNDAKAYITLGGKKTDDMDCLKSNIYDKIQNVIFVEYMINENNTFTVIKITLLYGLDREYFFGGLGTIYKLENRSSGQRTLKISQKNLKLMYGKKLIEYNCLMWTREELNYESRKPVFVC